MAGRQAASAADLWPLILAVPTQSEQRLARECLEQMLQETDNPALPHLAEETSAAPQVRARLLVEAGGKALEGEPDILRVEGVLRDIDASFSTEQLSSELAEMRARLRSALP
jgi:MoxR-like ATPase